MTSYASATETMRAPRLIPRPARPGGYPVPSYRSWCSTITAPHSPSHGSSAPAISAPCAGWARRTTHSSAVGLPGLLSRVVGHPQLADVVQDRGPAQQVAVASRDPHLLGEQVGEHPDPLGVAAGRPVVRAERGDQREDLAGDGAGVGAGVARPGPAAPRSGARLIASRASRAGTARRSGKSMLRSSRVASGSARRASRSTTTSASGRDGDQHEQVAEVAPEPARRRQHRPDQRGGPDGGGDRREEHQRPDGARQPRAPSPALPVRVVASSSAPLDLPLTIDRSRGPGSITQQGDVGADRDARRRCATR